MNPKTRRDKKASETRHPSRGTWDWIPPDLRRLLDEGYTIMTIHHPSLSYDELKPYLERGVILRIEAGTSGKALQNPVYISLRPGMPLRELDVVNYVISSLIGRCSHLVQWIVESPAMMRLAAYLHRYRSSSWKTLMVYAHYIHDFCEWIGATPDGIIAECLDEEGGPSPRGVKWMRVMLNEYVGEFRARGLAPQTIASAISAVRALLRVNGVEIPGVLIPQIRVKYEDRAPRPDELTRALEVADLREKVIISMLALGGFRIGTLCQLRYRHVRDDLERGVAPVHIHVEAEITKGKYGDYDTFIGSEAIEYLKLYLDQRRRGSPCGKLPPEEICGDSPLIRDAKSKEARPITPGQMSRIVHNLFIRAGLIERRGYRRCILRPHSIRKFFRTQLAALGVPPDYIEFMMGHKVPTYHDIKMKGVEFLRNIYAAAGLSIRPRTHVSRIEMLKEIIRAWGMDPERILVKEALTEPHRTIVAPAIREEEQVQILARALREMLRKELLG